LTQGIERVAWLHRNYCLHADIIFKALVLGIAVGYGIGRRAKR
jgi:hypothetical protein